MAAFADWLAHPNELGRAPDELKIVDHRTVAWPPTREPKEVWLIRYRMNDSTAYHGYDVGVGMVGSVTLCLFSNDLCDRPPDDVYAVHCYWEMRNLGMISEVSIAEHSNEFDHLMPPSSFQDCDSVTITLVAEFSQELGYPQRLIALARALRLGKPGWLVVDGPRSRWHTAGHSCDESSGHSLLATHIGRVLLSLDESH